MTKLELSRYKATSHSQLASLHSLRLRELTLLDCANIETAIFKPGALTALESLHIEESIQALAKKKKWRDSHQDAAEIEASKRQLKEAGAVVSSLPNLRQLSGSSEALSAWLAPASQGSATLQANSKVQRQPIRGRDGATTIRTYTRI